ncbi:MAG: response regulator transcription factor [Eubacterium sp.]|nr:response regulator transcription factor [Eubacterium sp.]
MMNVLIIEDDKDISKLIGKSLTGQGYNCKFAYDGEEGEELFDSNNWDMVLLDLMLPKVSGYELLEYIRPTRTPVIIMSAMNQVSDRIRGLNMGADDYLSKPFQLGELVARVEALIRRTMPYDDIFSYKGVTVNRSSRQVLKEGEEVALAPKEYELLNMLILNKNVALSREQLYETVWQEEYLGDTRTLDNHIKRLRQKLGYEDVIKTIFRIGYRMEVAEEDTIEDIC